jgi:hypothetical protein
VRDRSASGCGHHVGDRPRLISFWLAVQDPNQPSQLLSLHSITGGNRTLSWEACPTCHWSADYVYRVELDAEPQRIGHLSIDSELLREALLALLSQPAVDVFTLVGREQRTSTDRRGLSTYLVPRHQLPIFQLEHHRRL